MYVCLHLLIHAYTQPLCTLYPVFKFVRVREGSHVYLFPCTRLVSTLIKTKFHVEANPTVPRLLTPSPATSTILSTLFLTSWYRHTLYGAYLKILLLYRNLSLSARRQQSPLMNTLWITEKQRPRIMYDNLQCHTCTCI